MSEFTITAAFLAKLRAIPKGYALKVHGSEFQRAGVPDILFWKGGVPFAFEVKTMRGRVSKIQKVQLERMERAGVVCAVVRSVAEARAILGSFGIVL